MSSITVTAEATVEPVTIAEVKANSAIEITADDALIENLLKAARAKVCNDLARFLIDTTVAWRLDYGFPCWFEIPRGPLRSVTSIAYVDGNGDSQTLAANQYTVDGYHDIGRIVPAWGVSWPTTRGHVNDVTVTYVAGYGATADAVPLPLRRAVLLLVDHWYEHRGAVSELRLESTPYAYESLIQPYRAVY